MKKISSKNIQCKMLDHLGLVADTIDDLDLINLIDAALPLSKEKGVKVTMGERVASILFNALWFVNSRLYLFPEFLESKPVNRLFHDGIEAKHFNDDALGRCLDAISEYGTTKLFTELSFAIGVKKGLLGDSVNFDTTTLQLWGEDDKEEGGEACPMHGYSKSKRHDLKQMVLNLATTGKSSFPIWMESHSGNASDKTILPKAAEKMERLCKSLKDMPTFLYVGDSAMYSNSLKCPDLIWLSRVPASLKSAKELVQKPTSDLNWHALPNGYAYHVTESDYGNVKQRWVLIYSEQAYQREVKTLHKNIDKEKEGQEKSWWHLSNQVFSCAEDAKKAIKQQMKSLKYHDVSTKVLPITGHLESGRPKQGAKKCVKGYKIAFTLSPSETLINAKKREKGRFVLATNELDKSKLADEKVLETYKAQSGTEKGFKFIKSNTFEVDSVFVKKSSRITSLMMIMTLCLMVYGVAEHQVRQALVKSKEMIPNPGGKLTNKPTLKRVYFLFLGIQEVSLWIDGHAKKVVANITPLIRQIISYFGNRAYEIYLGPS